MGATITAVLTCVNTLVAVLAVFVSIRALSHTRDRSNQADTTREISSSTEARVKLTELQKQYDRMEDLIARLTTELMQHEKDCIADKTRLSENLKVVSENLVTVSGRLDAWAQQAAFMARDNAIKDTAARLGLPPP